MPSSCARLIRSLLLAVNCIDCACDAAIVTAVEEGISAALRLYTALLRTSGNFRPQNIPNPGDNLDSFKPQDNFKSQNGFEPQTLRRPLLMVSLNDDQDPHFRKAVFDPVRCPAECPRPCETICPAAAIDLKVVGHETGHETGPQEVQEGPRLVRHDQPER
jgi:Fe-S-cluster-containing hydrogenase component 2